MPARFLLALVLLLALVFTAFRPVPQSPELATCGSCAGAGKLDARCETCQGEGTSPCVECATTFGEGRNAMHVHVLRRTDPEAAKKLESALNSIAESMARIGGLAGRLTPPVPGRVACVARCTKGSSFLNPGFACKACNAKGSIACVACKSKGVAACEACAGKRTLVQPCAECAGSGRAPSTSSLTAADAARCAWCLGTELRECKTCDENGQRDRICPRCTGSGEHVCGQCRGTRKIGCIKCSATGDLSSFLAAKKSNNCDKCNKKGTLDCLECKRGLVGCTTCKGASRGPRACDLCIEKKAPCAGCWDGRTRSWTTTAERALVEKRPDVALAFFEEALRRTEAHAKARIEAAGDDAEAKRAIEKELARVRSTLRARIDAARKPG